MVRSSDLRRDVTHGGKHGDAAVLDLGLAAAREVLGVAIRGEAGRVEEANGRLHAKLTIEYNIININ